MEESVRSSDCRGWRPEGRLITHTSHSSGYADRPSLPTVHSAGNVVACWCVQLVKYWEAFVPEAKAVAWTACYSTNFVSDSRITDHVWTVDPWSVGLDGEKVILMKWC